ncbi:MAG: aminotransferase class V-fold PLP-dependent enzyme [Candidatus Omnitrophota bacterium]
MKAYNLDNIFLSKKAMMNVVLLLNRYRVNKDVNFRNKFEDELAKYLNVKHVFACTNGTNGLHIAMLALEVKTGDEIITHPLYNIATISSILKCGARPVLAKIKEDGAMDVDDVEKKINSNTRGIIAAHIRGSNENLAALQKLKKKHGLFIVEDACQALGSEIRIRNEWKKIGTIGDIGVFSFALQKLITTIEGGLIVTNNNKLAFRINAFVGQGNYESENFILGFNSRMDHLHAAIGLGNLESINFLISERKKRWLKYYDSLKDYTWLRILKPDEDQVTNYMSLIMSVACEKIRPRLTKLLLSKGHVVGFYTKGDELDRKFVNRSVDHELKECVLNFEKDKIELPTHHEVSESDINNIIKCFKCVNDNL